jgi:branched-chain amino acid transport system ATP-binding protein
MEDRPVFWYLTIEENLAAAAYSRWDGAVKADMEKVFKYFPVLQKLRDQKAGYTSGGEQQMLAIGIALVAQPRLLLMDEPLLGLSPLLQADLARAIKNIRQEGITVLVTEQFARTLLPIIDRGYVIENGMLVFVGSRQELFDNPEVKSAYLGI